MNKKYSFSLICIFSLLIFGCGIYSFTGSSVPVGAKTFQVNLFENLAGSNPGSIIEPGLDRDFTNALQDLVLNQTNLELVNKNGHLVYEGEIREYRISPTTATSEFTAAENRLTISINVRYSNTLNDEDDFEKIFSFFFNYPAESQLYDVIDDAHKEIFERITQDIFNASLAQW